MNSLIPFIEHKAYNLRKWSIIQTSLAGSGHVTSCLSAADIVATLFFYSMHYDPSNFENQNNDRFILSKGHAAPLLYAVWEQLGFLTAEDLSHYRSINSPLEGHPTYRFPYAQAATGSLGIGLSIGIGHALNARINKLSYYVYVLMGDSEMAEGSIWEAIFLASHYKLNNVVGIIDCNRLGQSTETMYGDHAIRYQKILESAGWYAYIVNGHDIKELIEAFDSTKKNLQKPTMIIACTYKGYGIASVENKEGFHGKPFSKQEMPIVLKELEKRFPSAAAYKNENNWLPSLPASSPLSSLLTQNKSIKNNKTFPISTYTKEKNLSTRKACGQALALLGDVVPAIVCLDAEVKNSTYTELFEQKHAERFFQCFIAEQNMLGIGIGLSWCKKIPFIATFGCFFTRAHDQIRMAVLNNAPLRLIGSHAGISIGQDGPSQMALEDISMMRTLPNSIVLYPSDAVATYKLIEQMAYYNKGISYLRITRADTPIFYDNNESFVIGGCKVLRASTHDQICIIAAGITLFEALKAHDLLKNQSTPIFTSVIDLYSIKPFDLNTILSIAQASGNKIITVEDHYIQGGIGEMVASALCNTTITVTSLAVHELPRSGTPEKLLAWAHIDAQAIINHVHKALN